MNNVQLATTLATPTGTGLLYTAYSQGEDIASYVNGSGATRSYVSLKRTQPKPTSVFPGVHRMELKRTLYFTVSGVEYQCVATLTTSIPVVADTPTRTDVYTNLALLARDSIWANAVTADILPT